MGRGEAREARWRENAPRRRRVMLGNGSTIRIGELEVPISGGELELGATTEVAPARLFPSGDLPAFNAVQEMMVNFERTFYASMLDRSDRRAEGRPDIINSLAEVEGVLRRFTRHALLAFLRVEFVVTEGWFDGAHVQLVASVPDRDSGQPTMVCSLKRVHYGTPVDRLRQLAREWLLELWLHEFDEGLRFDGRLVRDTHAGQELCDCADCKRLRGES